jgi:hypothetical protein
MDSRQQIAQPQEGISRSIIGQEHIVERLLLAGIVCLLLLAGVAWRFRSSLQSHWQAWKHTREFSKKAYFQRLGAACRQNDAKASYNRLLAW